mmetsp:Transcript_62804/g.148752  ORF Transcript_62804/g.148752 Transcript_62804/m.148752 type:complete len:219 (+) Transcript_62804:1463-2119(+)
MAARSASALPPVRGGGKPAEHCSNPPQGGGRLAAAGGLAARNRPCRRQQIRCRDPADTGHASHGGSLCSHNRVRRVRSGGDLAPLMLQRSPRDAGRASSRVAAQVPSRNRKTEAESPGLGLSVFGVADGVCGFSRGPKWEWGEAHIVGVVYCPGPDVARSASGRSLGRGCLWVNHPDARRGKNGATLSRSRRPQAKKRLPPRKYRAIRIRRLLHQAAA